MKGLKVLSLFDGISCGRVALEKVGIPVDTYYASEIDKYAIQISNKNWNDIIQIGDVRNVKGEDYNDIDIVIGGSPCQSFSFAGKKVGMTTKDKIEVTTLEQYLKLKEKNFEFEGYSYLFWEYVRVLKEIKPKYFLLENVKMAEKWEKIITDTLDVEPIEINSSCFSAQSRKRLYWTNIPIVELPQNNQVIKDILEEGVDKKYYMNYPIVLKDSRGEGLKQIGDIPRTALNDNERQRRVYSTDGKSPTILARSDTPKIICVGELNMKASKQIKQVFSTDGLSPTVDTAQGGHRQIKILQDASCRKLTPLECERLQTLPDNYTYGISDTQRYKCIGNGWTVDVIAHIFNGLSN